MSNSLTQLSAAQFKKAAGIREQIDRLEAELSKLLGGAAAAPAAKGKKSTGRGSKGGISAAGRARIAAAQRARWAKVRAAKGAKSK